MFIRYKAFSLVELLAVIAIVGIISVVAVPSYRHYRERANFAKVLPVIQDIAQQYNSIYNETGSYDPNNNLDLSQIGYPDEWSVAVTGNNYWISPYVGLVQVSMGQSSTKTECQILMILVHLSGFDNTGSYFANGTGNLLGVMYRVLNNGKNTQTVCFYRNLVGDAGSSSNDIIPWCTYNDGANFGSDDVLDTWQTMGCTP